MADHEALRMAERSLWDSLGVQPTERRVHLPSLGVDVRVQELGSGPPLLFIHGGNAWGTSWADLAVLLQSFTCLLLDRPGAGCSDHLPERPRTLTDLTSVADTLVPDVLDALDLEAAHLVATSFGGWFALRASLTMPLRVRRIAILGWTAGAPVARLPLSLRMGTFPVLGDLLGRMPAGPSAVRAIFRSIGEGPALAAGRITPEAIRAYAALLRHTATFQNERPLGRLVFSTGRGDTSIVMTDEHRQRISSPILFAWGDADPFGGADIAAAFTGGFPNAHLEILRGTGHVPWMDQGTHIAKLVTNFLAE